MHILAVFQNRKLNTGFSSKKKMILLKLLRLNLPRSLLFFTTFSFLNIYLFIIILNFLLCSPPPFTILLCTTLNKIQDLKAAQAALREQEEVTAKVAAESAANSDAAEEAEHKAATARKEAEAAKKAVETAKSQAKREVEEAKHETEEARKGAEEARKSAEEARSEARKEIEKAVAAALANAGASPNTIRKSVDDKRYSISLSPSFIPHASNPHTHLLQPHSSPSLHLTSS